MTLKYTLSDIDTIAKKILTYTTQKVLLFDGEMGVGKTTLIKSIAKELGVKKTTSSPTFSIVNEYQSSSEIIYHFDFYRLKVESEAYDMGVEEYLYSGNWCFIEWPNKIENLLPVEYTLIKIERINNEERVLVIENKSL